MSESGQVKDMNSVEQGAEHRAVSPPSENPIPERSASGRVEVGNGSISADEAGQQDGGLVR